MQSCETVGAHVGNLRLDAPAPLRDEAPQEQSGSTLVLRPTAGSNDQRLVNVGRLGYCVAWPRGWHTASVTPRSGVTPVRFRRAGWLGIDDVTLAGSP